MPEEHKRIGNDESVEHLKIEMPGMMQELEELHSIARAVTRKIQKREDRVKRHMMKCGTCLSRMVANGLLVDIQDYRSSEGNHGFRLGMS